MDNILLSVWMINDHLKLNNDKTAFLLVSLQTKVSLGSIQIGTDVLQAQPCVRGTWALGWILLLVCLLA